MEATKFKEVLRTSVSMAVKTWSIHSAAVSFSSSIAVLEDIYEDIRSNALKSAHKEELKIQHCRSPFGIPKSFTYLHHLGYDYQGRSGMNVFDRWNRIRKLLLTGAWHGPFATRD